MITNLIGFGEGNETECIDVFIGCTNEQTMEQGCNLCTSVSVVVWAPV